MKYDVAFTIKIDSSEVSILDFVDVQDLAPFPTDVAVGDGVVVVTCKGVESSGLMALPEALRKSQVQLSHVLRDNVPGFIGRGLLWGDVVAADIRTTG